MKCRWFKVFQVRLPPLAKLYYLALKHKHTSKDAIFGDIQECQKDVHIWKMDIQAINWLQMIKKVVEVGDVARYKICPNTLLNYAVTSDHICMY